MSNNKKPNHKKIQYMHKVQSKMKPDQHSHTHSHSRNQKANKRHNREERSSRQKHLTSVKIIWRRQRTKQKKRKETETERNERTNETPKCIVHIASTSPVIASSGHTTTTATAWDEHTDEIQTDKRHTHTHTDQQKIIMNVGHKNSPKRSTHTEKQAACTCTRAHTHRHTRKHSTHGAGNNKMKNGIPECLTRHSGASAVKSWTFWMEMKTACIAKVSLAKMNWFPLKWYNFTWILYLLLYFFKKRKYLSLYHCSWFKLIYWPVCHTPKS